MILLLFTAAAVGLAFIVSLLTIYLGAALRGLKERDRDEGRNHD